MRPYVAYAVAGVIALTFVFSAITARPGGIGISASGRVSEVMVTAEDPELLLPEVVVTAEAPDGVSGMMPEVAVEAQKSEAILTRGAGPVSGQTVGGGPVRAVLGSIAAGETATD